MSDATHVVPDRRVLRAAVDALKSRQRLPTKDRRRGTAFWLRPNWPYRFIMQTHRERILRLLTEDADFRAEVRELLGAELLDATPVTDLGEMDFREQLHAAGNAETFLEAASTHPDEAVVRAAVPYLTGELPLPERRVESEPSRPRSSAATAADPIATLRQQLRGAAAHERELREQLRNARAELAKAQTDLKAANDAAAAAKAEAADLRQSLPTTRQRRALERASDLESELRRTRRALDAARKKIERELRAAQTRLADAKAAHAATQHELERERESRHRREQSLGDANNRAQRLATLVEREIADLTDRADRERFGRDRSRMLKRLAGLEQLRASLGQLYPLELDGRPATPQPVQDAGVAVVTRDRGLRVTPLGGTNHIGGSALLIEAGDTRLLIDAGLQPNAHVSHPGPRGINDAIKARLDAIIITHAHADHAGYVPWVVDRQRQANVFCTPQTKSLLPTVWADSVRVMRAEADTPARTSEAFQPPYGDAEVTQAEEALKALPSGQTRTIKDLELTLFPAGHILGAAGVVVRAGERRVVITGDIDDRPQQSVGPAQIPERLARNADLLIIETTYCDSLHNDRQQEGGDLITEANNVLAAGGRILIPAFGLGRAQEIALLLGEHLPDVEVRVDGLAATISELYALNHAPEVLRGRVRKVTHRTREIRGFHNGIVITTSGMLTGGAAVPWAEAILPEPTSALFLCGHQDEEAPGKELERLAQSPPDSPRDIRLRDSNGRPVTISVTAGVFRYNLSAHADRRGLRGIIDDINPKAVMLVHGEPRPQEIFGAQLQGAGYRVVDNQQPWDSEASIPDRRRPRQGHAAKASRRRAARA